MAIISQREWPVLLGWLGVLTGASSAVTVLAAETPLAVLAAGAYLPSLTLAIVFSHLGRHRTVEGGRAAIVAARTTE